MKYKRVTCLPIRALAPPPAVSFSARVKSSWLRKAANTALLVAVASAIGGCVTGNTLAIARGSKSEKDTRGVENVNEEPHPEFYALVPLAVAADVALTPVYIVYTLGCFASGHLPY
jgi:hypothetical protein